MVITIAITIQVDDGLVFAADSASTILQQSPTGGLFAANVYDNANKISNLSKGLPVGVVTWGAGSIGSASISTIVKDFRTELDNDKTFQRDQYTIEDVANRFYNFIYTDRYVPAFSNWPNKPALGLLIGGYSRPSNFCEQWMIEVSQGGDCNGPYRIFGEDGSGSISWNGQEEPLYRLIRGYSSAFPLILKQVGLDDPTVEKVMNLAQSSLQSPLVISAMPIQDAIDLAEFLVDYTAKYYRFTPGAQTVGGPIEIAAVTKHEGFKWIKRKHYFDVKLNS